MTNQQPNDRHDRKAKAGRDATVVGRDYTDNIVGVERLKHMSWFTIIVTLLGLISGITSSLLAVKEVVDHTYSTHQMENVEQRQPEIFLRRYK